MVPGRDNCFYAIRHPGTLSGICGRRNSGTGVEARSLPRREQPPLALVPARWQTFLVLGKKFPRKPGEPAFCGSTGNAASEGDREKRIDGRLYIRLKMKESPIYA